MGEGFVVDVRHHALRDRDLLITAEHIKDSEKKHGKIPNKSILFLMTGRFWQSLIEVYLDTSFKTGNIRVRFKKLTL